FAGPAVVHRVREEEASLCKLLVRVHCGECTVDPARRTQESVASQCGRIERDELDRTVQPGFPRYGEYVVASGRAKLDGEESVRPWHVVAPDVDRTDRVAG